MDRGKRIVRQDVAVRTGRQEPRNMVELSAECIGMIQEENRVLADGLVLLDLAIACRAIDKWRWVGSVVEDLTDQNEVDKFEESIPPASPLYKDKAAAGKIVAFLLYWWKTREVVSRQNTLLEAFDILTDFLVGNMDLLNSIP